MAPCPRYHTVDNQLKLGWFSKAEVNSINRAKFPLKGYLVDFVIFLKKKSDKPSFTCRDAFTIKIDSKAGLLSKYEQIGISGSTKSWYYVPEVIPISITVPVNSLQKHTGV